MSFFSWARRTQVFALLFAVWMMGLATWVTYQMFVNPTAITSQMNIAFGTVYGLPALAVGLLKWRTSRNERQRNERERTDGLPPGDE